MCDRVVVINEGKFVKTQELGNSSENADIEKKYEIKTKDIERAQNVLKEKLNKEGLISEGKLYVNISRMIQIKLF